MRQITVSAPGKLMLLGEHAVVYGRPCLVTTVEPRMKVLVKKLDEPLFILEAKDIGINEYKKSITKIGQDVIPKETKFVEIAIRNFFEKYKVLSGIDVTTKTGFISQLGLGSSSAVTVCVIRALAYLFDIEMSLKEIFDLSYKTILNVQQEGSGFDVAAAIYGGTLYYASGGKIIEPLTANGLQLVVGYSGVKADTVLMINLVKEKIQTHKQGVEKIFDNIADLVEEAKLALLSRDWLRLGTLMNFNQNYLENLGVSTSKINTMIEAAQKTGACGAKLSGAGGGDCMIALVSPEKKKRVIFAIKEVGGEIIDAEINVPGVRIEEATK